MNKTEALTAKRDALSAALMRTGGDLAVAFSGGVDSSLLLAMAVETLGNDRVVALTADSPLLARTEYAEARDLTATLGVEHIVLPLDELSIHEIKANGPRRCYYCKRYRFQALMDWIERNRPGAELVHGENADDLADYRPGSQAAKELGIRAPLVEASLSKADIRALSKEMGLQNWAMPAAACLATRFSTNTGLDQRGLARVEEAERLLSDILGHAELRVRDHYPVARIEVPDARLGVLLEESVRGSVDSALRSVGYRHVALDLRGYRMGSMNEQPA